MITIVDYGMGNLGSVENMFKKIGIATETTGDLKSISRAQKILLPGVGAFDAAMKRILETDGLLDVLNQKALGERVPVLGICLGMQLLTNGSEEGLFPGLGWIDAETIKFKFSTGVQLKVPHMGWNEITIQNDSVLLKNLDNSSRFYFVHSYYVQCRKSENVLANTFHGMPFNSIISNKNIFGAQFHPEKSHKFGMQLLKNFAEL